MGHEERVDGVQGAHGIARDTGVLEVRVSSVPGQLPGERHPALCGAEQLRVGDRGTVELLPARRFAAERVGDDLAQQVRGVLGEHLVVLGQFGGDLDPLGAQPALGVGGGDHRVLAVLVVQRAPSAHAPVGELAGGRLVEAELRLGRVPEPGDGHPLGVRIAGFEGEVRASLKGFEALELILDNSVPAVENTGRQLVGEPGGGER